MGVEKHKHPKKEAYGDMETCLGPQTKDDMVHTGDWKR
jgi:hypothetical protein